MKLHYRYFTLILFSFFLGSDLIHAQVKDAEQSEIVMRQSELDSLLLKIVRYKKEQMAKERKYRYTKASESIDSILQPQEKSRMITTPMDEQSKQQGSINEERIFNEFARLNNRLDGLILNMGTTRGVSSVPPQQSFSAPSEGDPNVFYIQPDGQQHPALAPGFGQSPSQQQFPNEGKKERIIIDSGEDDQKLSDAEAQRLQESAKLQYQINDLTEKMRVLGKLEETSDNGEYDAEISELNAQITALKDSLEESNKAAAAERESKAKSQQELAALKDLREYSLKVYFANNSTTLGSSDKMALEELAKIVKNHQDNVTVMLHGFASKSGSAAYNNKISFERAEAVKKALQAIGIRARNIVTLPHGVDDSGDAAQARRVEVSLVVM
ncbi:MAG TPA: OmpA family protein [Flavobacteriaceae bacterium]|nr:OmpA family protein [Flavobacteriaceae bacterium]